MKKVLLHVCCGPCSTEVISRLSEDDELTLFFFNPNIFPREEYDRRLAEARKYASDRGIPLIWGDYDHDGWLEAVRGLEEEPEGGERCRACFAHRLGAAARKARETGAEAFTTTLTISPHKNAAMVNAAGEEAGKKEMVPKGPPALCHDSGPVGGQLGLHAACQAHRSQSGDNLPDRAAEPGRNGQLLTGIERTMVPGGNTRE